MKHTGALKVALALGICLTALGAKAAGEDAASYTYPAPAPPPTEHGEFSDKRFYGSWQVGNTTTYVFRPGYIVHIDYLFERNRDVRPKDYDEYFVILREFENRVILKVWDAKETLLPHEKITYRIYVLTLRPLSGI